MGRLPSPDLVLVEADAAFGLLKRFLDGPAGSGEGDQVAQAPRLGRPAAVERLLAGREVLADQQVVVPGGLFSDVEVEPAPGVFAGACAAPSRVSSSANHSLCR